MSGKKGSSWRSTPGRHMRWRAEIVAAIQRFDEEHSRPPTSRELGNLSSRAKLVFGSWSEAVRVAGLVPHRQGQRKQPPRVDSRDRLPLTSRAGVRGYTVVDPADYDRFAGRHLNLGTDGYAYCRDEGRQVALHRLILGLKKGDGWDVDHINGDRLDNRRANLRRCTRAENLENRTVPSGGRSRFRGVTWSAQHRRWQAKGTRHNRSVHIGVFDDELNAAIAAQRWRDLHMPFSQPDPALVEELGEWTRQTEVAA